MWFWSFRSPPWPKWVQQECTFTMPAMIQAGRHFWSGPRACKLPDFGLLSTKMSFCRGLVRPQNREPRVASRSTHRAGWLAGSRVGKPCQIAPCQGGAESGGEQRHERESVGFRHRRRYAGPATRHCPYLGRGGRIWRISAPDAGRGPWV